MEFRRALGIEYESHKIRRRNVSAISNTIISGLSIAQKCQSVIYRECIERVLMQHNQTFRTFSHRYRKPGIWMTDEATMARIVKKWLHPSGWLHPQTGLDQRPPASTDPRPAIPAVTDVSKQVLLPTPVRPFSNPDFQDTLVSTWILPSKLCR